MTVLEVMKEIGRVKGMLEDLNSGSLAFTGYTGDYAGRREDELESILFRYQDMLESLKVKE